MLVRFRIGCPDRRKALSSREKPLLLFPRLQKKTPEEEKMQERQSVVKESA